MKKLIHWTPLALAFVLTAMCGGCGNEASASRRDGPETVAIKGTVPWSEMEALAALDVPAPPGWGLGPAGAGELYPSPAIGEPPAEPGFDDLARAYRGAGFIRIAAAGDIMLQRRCNRSSRARSKGEENNDGYDELFPDLGLALSDADIAMANMEFPVFKERQREVEMVFYGTSRVTNAIKKAGFTLVTGANNHGFDHGRQSPASTARECARAGLPCIGVGENREQAERPYFFEKGGVKIAIIGYSLLANANLNKNDDDSPRVNGYRLEPLLEQVREARKKADAVVVTVHWGAEYHTYPNVYQKRQAREIADAGAALILGHHAHVLQPVDVLETADGRKVLVIYSLGNFTTNQGRGSYYSNTRLGNILKADLAVTERGVEVVRWESHPTWVYNAYSTFEGSRVEDIHVEVTTTMIEKLERERDEAESDKEKASIDKRIGFYKGRIEAAERILKMARGETPGYVLD